MHIAIQSRENERVKQARLLATQSAQRSAEGLFFAEGARLCFDLAETHKLHSVFVTQAALARWPEAESLADDIFVVSDAVAQKLAGTKTPQGFFCLFVMRGFSLDDLDVPRGVLLCEDVQDPANVGAMLRTAAGLGMGGAVLAGGCADAYSEKALRASMGAVGRIPLVRCECAADACAYFKPRGARLVAAALDEAAIPLYRWRPGMPAVLLVGNEGAGLCAETLALADEKVYIPMQNGVQSLNAAAAAAILMARMTAEQAPR